MNAKQDFIKKSTVDQMCVLNIMTVGQVLIQEIWMFLLPVC